MATVDHDLDARFKRLPAPSAASDDLSSTFGMHEMERAARRIVAQARAAGSWSILLDLATFKDNDDDLVGALNLVGYGWLEPDCGGSNWAFVATRAFVRRVVRGPSAESRGSGSQTARQKATAKATGSGSG